MADPVVIAQVQLRDKLQSLRTRVGEEATDRGKSLLQAHRRVDSRLAQRVRDADAPARFRRRFFLSSILFLAVAVYLAFFVAPLHYPEWDSFVVRNSGGLTYSGQRLLRFVSLPFMWQFPRLSTYLYNPACHVNNPWYVPEEEESVLPTKGKRGVKRSKQLPVGPGGDLEEDINAVLDDEEEAGEACSCLGIRGAGKIKNKVALKMKHITKDPGIPLILRSDNSTGLAQTKALTSELLKVLADHRDDFGKNICHAAMQGSNPEQSCPSKVSAALDTVLGGKATEAASDFFASWTYCRSSSDTAASFLRSAMKPETYLLSKNIVFSESPTLIVSRPQDKADADTPDSLMVDLDYGVYHQLAGHRKFTLQPTSCSRCKTIRVTLDPGDVLIFHGAVYQESPGVAVVSEDGDDGWSLTYGYSIGTDKSHYGSIYHTSDWVEDSNSCDEE